MTRIAQLDSMVFEARSPDRMIVMRLTDHRRVAIRLTDPDALQRYIRCPDTLAHGLATGLNLLWNDYKTTVDRLLAEAGSRPPTADHWDADIRRYRAEVRSMRVIGMSPGKMLRISSVNMTDFSVRIRPGSMEGMTEPRLVQEVNGALQNMQAHHRNQLNELKNKHFNLGTTAKTVSAPLLHRPV